jgi:hypothetical protein
MHEKRFLGAVSFVLTQFSLKNWRILYFSERKFVNLQRVVAKSDFYERRKSTIFCNFAGFFQHR